MPFTTTDGTVFQTRKEWKKHEMLTQYTFANSRGAQLSKATGTINGQPFDISELEDCTVVLACHSDMVLIDECHRCKIMVGASSESVFVRNCSDCEFFVACKQLRTRDCEGCTFSLYSQTEPVIETSKTLSFYAFAGGFPGQREAMRAANLDPARNFWWGIFDFNDEAKTGKNFELLPDGDAWWPLGECEQTCERSRPGSAPLPSQEGDGMGGSSALSQISPSSQHAAAGPPPPGSSRGSSFDIRTGQAAAEASIASDDATACASAAARDTAELAARASVVLTDAAPSSRDWTASRVGLRYSPLTLAVEYTLNDAQGTTFRRDMPLGRLEPADDAEAVLARLSAEHSSVLDFENKLSRKQVTRILQMLLQYSKAHA